MKEETIKKPDIMRKNERKEWSKTVTVNDITKTIKVEQVSNGFIIYLSKYGTNPKTGKYEDYNKKIISKENPLEDSDELTDMDYFNDSLSELKKLM